MFTRIAQASDDEQNYIIARDRACFAVLNIYPYNNLVLYYSSLGLLSLIILLALHDLIVFKNISRILNFFPDIKGIPGMIEKFPSLEEWASAKTWKSLPKWITAVTLVWVCFSYALSSTFSVPEMNKSLTEYINKDSVIYSRIGTVKGFSFFKGGSSTTTTDSTHLELTIRVYGEKGNFPLEVFIDRRNGNNAIRRMTMLRH